MRSIKLQGAWEASKIESQTIYSSLVFPNLCHSKQDNSSEASFVTFLLKKKALHDGSDQPQLHNEVQVSGLQSYQWTLH